MGEFYGSVQVRTEDRGPVKRAAEQVVKAKGIRCLLGPALKGWVGIYPEDNGQDATVAEEISRLLPADVLHILVHDGEVMAYCLWRNAEQVDSYLSLPGYFSERHRQEEEAMVGRPEVFTHLEPGEMDRLQRVLQREPEDTLSASSRLEMFADVLDIVNAVTAYESLKEGDREGIRGWRQFEELPGEDVAAQELAARERRRRIRDLKKQLRKSGRLLLEEVRKHEEPLVCMGPEGFVVLWPGRGANPSELVLHAKPWKAGEPVVMELPGRVYSLVSEGSGRLVAAALFDRAVVWSTDDWRVLQEVPEPQGVLVVALSADGRAMAHSSPEAVHVTDVEAGTRSQVLPGMGRNLAFHPSGEWLIAATNDLAFARLDTGASAEWRHLKIGGKAGSEVIKADYDRMMRSMSPEEKEQQKRVLMDAVFKQLKRQLEQAGQQLTPERVALVRRHVEKEKDRILAQVGEMMASHPAVPARIDERITCASFTPDGAWLCCGTDHGLRVYSWAAVPAADGGDMPSPTWRCDMETTTEYGNPAGTVNAIAHEPDGKGVLFGGFAGQLFRMDLGTGQVRHLMTIPEEEPIRSLNLSIDGKALGIVSRPGRIRQGPRDDRVIWSIWSYPDLLAAPAEDGLPR